LKDKNTIRGHLLPFLFGGEYMEYKDLIVKIKKGLFDNRDKIKKGCSNNNYAIDGKYFVRISTGIKENEHKILEILQTEDFVPNLYYYDDNTGDMVSEYINGSTLKYKDINNSDTLKAIADTLKKLHGNKVDYIFNPVEQIYLMYKKIRKQQEFEFYNSCIKEMESLLKKYSVPENLGLCHNDITAGNIMIQEGKVYLIDFEFSGMNDIYYDLAGLCCMLDDEQRKNVLTDYFEDEQCDQNKLNDYIKINFLWNASWNIMKYLSNGDSNHLEYAKEYTSLINQTRKK
jgi:thiamine kinase-like enzyme